MGHRSWLKEIKSVTELRNMLLFIAEDAAHLEVFFLHKGVPFIGWASDGSTAGNVFRKKFPRGKFGLLGEMTLNGNWVDGKYLHKNAEFFTSRTLLKFFKQLPNPDGIDYKEIRKAASSTQGN